MSLSSINLLRLTDSMIQPRQHCEGQGHSKSNQGHTRMLQVKGQIKITPGRCTPTPPTNVPTKYQLPIPYGF